jgi:DNA-binding NarL/FixJ family response regulator
MELRVPTRVVSATRLEAFNARDNEILRCLAEGLSNSQIGGRLGVSEKTIRNRLTVLYGRLSVGNRAAAAVAWVTAGAA